VKIVVDAMGGDNAPESNVLGVIDALGQKDGFDVVLIGNQKMIDEILLREKSDTSRINVVNATETIEHEEEPVSAIRHKKDSSVVIGINMIKDKKADVFMSAGDTGLLLVGGKLIIKTISGVQRPALPALIPSENGHTLVVDAGANTVCDPVHILQFAKLGSVYMQSVLGISNPAVGLVNVGTEDRKGPPATREAFALLKESSLNFVGNIEAREVFGNGVDVAVCDGYVGNVLLKTIEGTAKFAFSNVKEILTKGILNKIAGAIIKGDLKKLVKKLDSNESGGTLLLGLNGYVIKCHGDSTRKGICNSVLKAIELCKIDLIEKTAAEFTL
jgi:glycerol-3-phosphate acyltransferase PlsX